MSKQADMLLICRICRKPVGFGIDAVADEHGKTVHEACYLSHVIVLSEDQRLRDLFEQTANEQDSEKLIALVGQINRILSAKGQRVKIATSSHVRKLERNARAQPAPEPANRSDIRK